MYIYILMHLHPSHFMEHLMDPKTPPTSPATGKCTAGAEPMARRRRP